MEKFEIAISTLDRTPQYVHSTLDSMHVADPDTARQAIRLVVCGTSPDYLGAWLRRPNITAEHMRAGAFDETIGKAPPEGRTLLNFRRVLGRGSAPMLALQDDLAFSKNWIGSLENGIEWHEHQRRQHPNRYSNAYVIALYASYRMKGKPIAHYNVHRFYGNQAIWLSGAARCKLAEYIDRELAAGRPRPDDMFVKIAAELGVFDLFMLNPNVVQHAGKSSSLGLRFHKSPTFKP